VVTEPAAAPEGTGTQAAEGRGYRILGTIGKGGFGTVYKAELLGEGGFTKAVALKVLNPEVAAVPEVAQRLRDEARVLGLVRHRAIVQVDSLAQLDGRWTIVMEWVEGADLKRIVKRGPVPQGPALEIVAEVANALRVAYEQPGPDGRPLCLLHRDIKPSNLTVTPAGEVKVLDFGTARGNFATREAKTEQLAFGTIDYMSPERLEFQDLPAGDVYALGAVLYEMLVGDSLGRTSARMEKHTELRQRAIAALEAKGVKEGVVELLKDMLAFDPNDRPTPRQIESRCRDLRSGVGGPWLSDWAQDVVRPLVTEQGGPSTDEMTGAILMERSGSRPIPQPEQGGTQWIHTGRPAPARDAAPEPVPARTDTPLPSPAVSFEAPEPQPRGPSTLAIVALVVFAVLAGAGTIGALMWFQQPAPPVAAAPPPQPEPQAQLQPEPEPEPEPESIAPEPEPPAEAAPEPAKAAAPKPKAAPKPAAKPTGRWVAEGDAAAVKLVDGKGKAWGPGEVPAGAYTIEADFGSRGQVSAGKATITAGQKTTVSCQQAFARCSTR
jgi:serine/threonine protein kinase